MKVTIELLLILEMKTLVILYLRKIIMLSLWLPKA